MNLIEAGSATVAYRWEGDGPALVFLHGFPLSGLTWRKVVATVSGRVQLTVPKGTSSGKVFRLRGKGVRNLATGATGDQLVTVHIVLPDKIDDSLSYFMSEWRQKHRYDPGRGV